MKKYLSKIIVFLLLLSPQIAGQSNQATLSGKVTDEKGESLPGANVILKETNNGAASDRNGLFRLIALPGEYTVEVSFIGFEKQVQKINLIRNRTVEITFRLKSTSFEIGNIEVVADNEFIPISPETKTVVTSGEIEHIQASSLGDVLKLIPGVETTNPTLNNVERARIRSGDALGTQIVMDGIPITNNANMQIGVGASTANSGIDLRSIPAENIQDVEIIRGIPSVQYGDLIDGLMIVRTKATAEPLRGKIKYNPQLYEANISGGKKLYDWIVNANFNFATSDRDVRVEGDGYIRIAAQLALEKDAPDYTLKNIFYFTRTFDDRKEQPGYALRDAWYNRDMNFKYTGNYIKSFSTLDRFKLNVSVSYTRQNSYEQRLISRDNLVLSNRFDEGTNEGRIVFGSYLGQRWINGDVWNIFADANYNFRHFTGDFLHSWLIGATYRNDFNKGDGIKFDPLFPPVLSSTSPRLRTYNDLPAYTILSIYAEDRITGRLWKPFTLQIGVRYEVFRPTGFNIKGLWGQGDLIESNNGSFLNPRINFSYNLFEDTQIRLSYGTTAKSPPMGMIFAERRYYDIVDTVAVVNPLYPDSNFSLITTHIREQANENINGYTQRKYEASIDQQIDFFGFSITGFINNTSGMFQSYSLPTAFYRHSYPNWPDISTGTIKDTILETFNQYTNNGWLNVKGIEFTLRTKRIPVINTVFRFDASYTYQESGSENGFYFSSRRLATQLGGWVLPMYNSFNNYSKDLLFNYRFEIQAQSLGMWLTFHIQQKVIEVNGRSGYDDTLAIGYYNTQGNLVTIPDNERSDPRYSQLRRNIQSFELNEEDKPNKFLFNLKVSKSLWKGAAVSFFVNNVFNNQPLYMSRRRAAAAPSYERRNPDIFYGMEFHTSLGGIL